MRKQRIIISVAILIVCFLVAGAFFYGKSQNNQPVRTAEKERVSAEESLKTKASSSCIDEANKIAADKLKDLVKQGTSGASESTLETEIREQLRKSIINCSM